MNPDGLAAAVRYLGPRRRRPKQSLVLTSEACTAPSLVTPASVAQMQVGAACGWRAGARLRFPSGAGPPHGIGP
jgi:hypothetical protein